MSLARSFKAGKEQGGSIPAALATAEPIIQSSLRYDGYCGLLEPALKDRSKFTPTLRVEATKYLPEADVPQ